MIMCQLRCNFQVLCGVIFGMIEKCFFSGIIEVLVIHDCSPVNGSLATFRDKRSHVLRADQSPLDVSYRGERVRTLGVKDQG